MRRLIVTTITAAAVALAGLVMLPPATAGVDPTVTSASSAPNHQVIKISSIAVNEVATAEFYDPGGMIDHTLVTVRYTGGKTATVNNVGSTAGDTRTFTHTYRPSNATAPGEYRVTFKAVPTVGSFASPIVATAKFFVSHKTRLIVSAKARSYNPGALVRFSGAFYPHYKHAKGTKLILSVDKAGGKKRFVKVGTTKVNKSANYKFERVRVWKTGRYRVTFKGDKYSKPSQVTIKRQVF